MRLRGTTLMFALVLALGLGVPAQADFATPNWFDRTWHYRVPLDTGAGAAPSTTVQVDMDFAALLASMNVAGTLDANSVRVVRPDATTLASRQEFTDRRFAGATDAAGNQRGEVSFLVQDGGPARYWVYFDVTANGAKAPWPQAQTINGNFEFGASGWTIGATNTNGAENNEIHPTGGEGATVTLAAGCTDGGATTANTANTADSYHLIGYRDNCEDGSGNELVNVQRTIRVPNLANPGNLVASFRLQGFDSYNGGTQYDWFRMYAGGTPTLVNHNNLSIPNGDAALFIGANGVGRATAFSTAYEDEGWRQLTLDLTPYRNQLITVRFEMRYFTDQAYRTWSGLDDVSWSVVGATIGTAESFGANVIDPADTGAGNPITQYDVGDTLSIAAQVQTTVGAGRVLADVLDNAGLTVASDIPLFDDGSHGDASAGDGTWTNDGSVGADPTYTFTTSDPIGASWTLRVRARDALGLARIPGQPATPVSPANYYNVDDQVFQLQHSVSGRVYHDAQPNRISESSEDWSGAPAVFVNVVQGGAVIQSQAVPPGTGAFVFKGLAAGSYSLVVSDGAANPLPVAPAEWLFVEPSGGLRPLNLTTRALADQDLGLFHGSRVRGEVFRDDGAGGGSGNDAVRNGSEQGLGGAELSVTDGTGSITWAEATSEADGGFELWIPSAAGASALRIVEINPPAHRSTGGNAGTTAGTYDLPSDVTTFSNGLGVDYGGVSFADVPENSFEANGQQSALAGIVVFYPHTFIAGSEGDVSFSLAQSTTPAGPAWSSTLLHDLDCDALIDPGEPELTTPVATLAQQQVCVIVRNTIPEGAALESQDQLEITALFSYANSAPVATSTHTLTDLTIVSGEGAAGLVLHKSVDKASALPGEVLVYTVEYTNTGSGPLSNVEVFDATPAFTTFVSAGCGATPPGLSCSVSVQPAPGATGEVQWSVSGSLPAAASGIVTYSVLID